MRYDMAVALPNRCKAGTLSGGAYETSLPLSNAENTELGAVARTTNLDLASTKAICDLGQARYVRLVCLFGTNISPTALIRISGGTSSGGSQVYAGSWVAAWTLTTIDAAMTALGVETEGGLALPRGQYPVGVVLPAALSARYWSIEIDDASNADGYVEFARMVLAGLFSGTYGTNTGVSNTVRDLSGVGEAEGGADWSYVRTRQRKTSVLLSLQPQDGQAANELRLAAGITQECVFVASKTDREEFQRGSFLARFEEVPAWEFPYAVLHSFPVRLVERV